MAMSIAQQTATPDEHASRRLTIVEAVREALREEMQRDERVVMLGEDIGQLGGVFRATDGLLAQFGPGRVIDTPMMELGIAGIAVGMAMRGLRPVAEIQFADFMHAAADHVISDAARIRFRTNGDAACPLVIRTAYGGGLRGGPYHSQSVEAYYAHVPGLRVVAASFASDAKGLLTAAIRHPDPVLFLEHKRTYRGIRGEVPLGEHVVALDRAHVVRPGRDATVVAWGWVLHEALAAAEQLGGEGIEVEVIDPRSLNPLDTDTILGSVRQTGRLCVVHEDTRTMGLGAEIAALAAEFALDDLRAPVERLAMPDVAGIPASGPMEDFLIPDRARIAARLKELALTDRSPRVNGRGFSASSPLPGEVAAPFSSAPAGSSAGSTAPFSSAPVGSSTDAVASVPSTGSAAAARQSASEVVQVAPTWVDMLEASNRDIPQAASVVEIDLSRVSRRLEDFHAAWTERGIQPSFTPFFVEALLAALRRVPQANAAFDPLGRGIRHYTAVHLGLSVASLDQDSARHGLIVDADTRNVLGLAVEVHHVRCVGATGAERLGEATICLADYGPGSALFGVPQVLPGQVAAVRIGVVEERLVVRDRGFALAPTAYVCASIDHRALDGVDAGALLGEMKRFLEDDG
ncbi:MAG: transketolase C-terminal domain-containing protein [Chloroflexota bacterium]